jgi:lysophospholipase L1-like esterase
MRSRHRTLARAGACLASCAIAASAHAATAPSDVILVGDSITAGYGASSSSTTYASDLAQLFGSTTSVQGFGHPGATMIGTSTSPFVPYVGQVEYKDATAALSAIDAGADADVVIMLGTNDSATQNWLADGGTNAAAFATAYAAMVDHFAALGPHPHVYAALPPAIYSPVTVPSSNDDCILRYQILPIIRQVAADKGLGTIDVYAATSGHPEYFVTSSGTYDVHPNDMGHQAIAQAMYGVLSGSGLDAGPDLGGACDGGAPPVMDAGGGQDGGSAGEAGVVPDGGGAANAEDAASDVKAPSADGAHADVADAASGQAPSSRNSSGGCAAAPGAARGVSWLLGLLLLATSVLVRRVGRPPATRTTRDWRPRCRGGRPATLRASATRQRRTTREARHAPSHTRRGHPC